MCDNPPRYLVNQNTQLRVTRVKSRCVFPYVPTPNYTWTHIYSLGHTYSGFSWQTLCSALLCIHCKQTNMLVCLFVALIAKTGFFYNVPML